MRLTPSTGATWVPRARPRPKRGPLPDLGVVGSSADEVDADEVEKAGRALSGHLRREKDEGAEFVGGSDGDGAPNNSADSRPTPAESPSPAKQHRRWRWGKIVAATFSLGIAVLSVIALGRTFTQLSLAELRAAFAATSAEQLAGAVALTGVSFLALTGYDALALRQLRVHVPYPTAALASFTSYAISFTLGFPLITAGTVRYWIYSQAGLTAGKVASLTVIAGVTFWLGMALVIGVSLIARAETISAINHLEAPINIIIGVGVLAGLAAYLLWVSFGHRHTKMQGFQLELPGFKLTVGQVALGVVDLCAAAGVLYVLLPMPRQIDFFTFAATYVFGCVLGIASNAPGGIGVFEAAMLSAVPVRSAGGLLASLLLFRVIYYLIPFVLALAFLGTHETFRRWKSLRQAMAETASNGKTDDPD